MVTIPNAVKIEQSEYHTSTEENATNVIITFSGASANGPLKSEAYHVHAMKQFNIQINHLQIEKGCTGFTPVAAPFLLFMANFQAEREEIAQ